MTIAKSLVKRMSIAQAQTYCDNHPPYKIPTSYEAEELDIDQVEYDSFLVSDTLGGRVVVYNKRKQVYKVTHPQFLHHVVVITQGNNRRKTL